MEVKPEPRRNGRGQYLIVPAEGGKAVAHSRCTNIAKVLDNEEGLTRWKLRNAVKGIGLRRDLYALAVATPLSAKGALQQVCSEAMEAAGANERRNLGTAIHAFMERVDGGEEDVFIPEAWEADVRAYRTCLEENGITVHPDLIEVVAVCDALPKPIAGTIDRIVTWKDEPVIADVKTGFDLQYSWHSISVQLAIYSRSKTLYDTATETHSPMPAVNQDHAIVFHVPAGEGRCEPYLVDLNAGWEAAQLSVQALNWRNRKDLARAA